MSGHTNAMEWVDALLYLIKRLLTNTSGALLVVMGLSATVLSLGLFISKAMGNLLGSSDMMAASILLVFGPLCLVGAWYLFSTGKTPTDDKASIED